MQNTRNQVRAVNHDGSKCLRKAEGRGWLTIILKPQFNFSRSPSQRLVGGPGAIASRDPRLAMSAKRERRSLITWRAHAGLVPANLLTQARARSGDERQFRNGLAAADAADIGCPDHHTFRLRAGTGSRADADGCLPGRTCRARLLPPRSRPARATTGARLRVQAVAPEDHGPRSLGTPEDRI